MRHGSQFRQQSKLDMEKDVVLLARERYRRYRNAPKAGSVLYIRAIVTQPCHQAIDLVTNWAVRVLKTPEIFLRSKGLGIWRERAHSEYDFLDIVPPTHTCCSCHGPLPRHPRLTPFSAVIDASPGSYFLTTASQQRC